MKTAFVAIRAALWAAAFLLLWAWIAGALERYDRVLLTRMPRSWTGLPVLALGLALALWCIAVFVVRGRGTPAPFDPPRRLVAVGPYRYVRNPMYLGGALALLGFGLLRRSPSIVAFVPVWWLLFHIFVLVYEEPALRSAFRDDYDRYCRRTPRWLPRFASTAVALFLCAALLGADGKPDFSGVWKLDKAKSDFGVLPPPETRTDEIRHHDPALEIASRHSYRGAADSVGEWKCRTDGVPCPLSIRGADVKLSTAAAWKDGALVLESEGDYQGSHVAIVDRWTLSPDRKTLTIARRMTNDIGEAHQNLVFDRQ